MRIGRRDAYSAPDEDLRPWVVRHMNQRAPFLVVPLLAQLSALLPPGITVPADFWLSTGLLLLMVVLWMLLPRVVPQGHWVLGAPLLTSCIYTASIALLMGATSPTRSGLGILLLLPVVGVALYGDVWESAVIVPLVALTVSLVNILGGNSVTVTLRQFTFFLLLGAMTSVSVQILRARLVASNRRKRRLLAQAETLSVAAEKLSVLSSPATIMTLGAELAASMALPATSGGRVGMYLGIDNGVVSVLAKHDDGVTEAGPQWLLGDHPALAQAVASGRPVAGDIYAHDMGPTWTRVVDKCRIVHAVWVPVCPDGSLHGVLAVAGRDGPVSQDSEHQCVALGHLLELALVNWSAHERLEEHARSEERRRIARDLHDGMAHELAYMATKARTSSTGAPSRDELYELANAADRALDEARRAISVLSSPSLERLQQCVARTAEDMCARFGIDVRLDLDDSVELPGAVTEHVLRIVREAITNAGRHGAAQVVSLSLSNGNGIRLRIEDDGCGFDTAAPTRTGGFGLLSMEERAASIGAMFRVESEPAQGTTVDLVFP